jgi:hypothetical protein
MMEVVMGVVPVRAMLSAVGFLQITGSLSMWQRRACLQTHRLMSPSLISAGR